MRIQFISNYSQLYGANRSLLSLIDYFHNNSNYQVNVLLPSKGSMSIRLAEKGIPFDIIPYYSGFLYVRPKLKHIIVPMLAILDVFLFPFIIAKIYKFNPDLIYSNTSAENLGVFAAKILNKKHILHVREFMSLDHCSFFIFGSEAKRRFMNLSNGVIFVSKSVLKEIVGGKKLTAMHEVIYNGISTPVKLIKDNQKPEKINYGIVGILDAGKGQHLAIEYFQKLLIEYPNSKLHIIGDNKGKYKNKLKNQVESLNLEDKVIFHGFVNNPDEIYSLFDVLFMFSKSEGFGRVTVEAMMRGIPVVGFDNAGTAELIVDKKTGCLFFDYNSFKNSIQFLLHDTENFNFIRLNAFKKITETCNETVYCQNVENFINKVLKA